MKIGIAITTHNRPQVAKATYEAICKFRPPDSIVAIVDDASYDPPFGFYNNWLRPYYRFEQRVGVSMAKNKCLEILTEMGCDELFLFDDDCYPIENNWWKVYIESPLLHACWTFGRRVIDANAIYTEYEKPCGCMLYFKRGVIDFVGGWDLEFTGYGFDHVNFSDRIFNNGLTPARYIHPTTGKKLFEMADCESSFTSADREQIPTNLKLYQQKFYSKEFKPFK